MLTRGWAKVIDVSDILNLGLSEEEVEVARWRITGYIRPSALADRAFAALHERVEPGAEVLP